MDMSFLPYPPPPEPGWYDDDAMVSDQIVRTAVSDARNVDGFRRSSDVENPVDAIDGDDIDRDGTVLASSFAMRTTPVYLLRNEQTGQEVLVDGNVLLGREPSAASEGAKAVGLKDPTRTISRNRGDRTPAGWHVADSGLRFAQRHVHHPRRCGDQGRR